MKRPSFRSVIVALCLLGPAASGCAPAAPSDDGPVGRDALALSGVCGETRWVGVANACTAPQGWSAARLFAPPSPPQLAGYCTYAWTGNGAPTQAEVAALEQGSGAAGLTEDCPVIAPQAPVGSSYDEALASALRDGLRAQVAPAAGWEGSKRKPGEVRVIVVDSSPDALHGGPITRGLDPHGYTLAHVIADLAGLAGAPTVRVGSALALPWIDANHASPAGGTMGRLSDVASAVDRAYKAWNADGRGERLVMNLSIGWENVPGVADCLSHRAELHAPARAVYDVLQLVAAEGVLVIAAAGNDPGGPKRPEGLICPAMWEADAVPGTQEPMLHAVGGVDSADEPIALTRVDGMPHLAGTSLGGVGWAEGDVIPPPLTGTSVGAAVMSAVSAVTWASRPALDAAGVVSRVEATAVPVGDAGVCPAGTTGPCDVLRVSLCAAETGPCAPSPPRSTIAAGPTLTGSPSFFAAVAPFLASAFPGAPVATPGLAPVDPATLPRFEVASSALSGGVCPQPSSPICPSCTLTSSSGASIFYANLSSAVTSPTLVVQSGSTTTSVPLSSSTTPTSYAVGSASGATSAYVTGTVSGASVTQQVPISP